MPTMGHPSQRPKFICSSAYFTKCMLVIRLYIVSKKRPTALSQDGVPTELVLSMFKVRAVTRRILYAITRRSLAMSLHCRGVACVSRAGRRSVFFRTPWGRRHGVTDT